MGKNAGRGLRMATIGTKVMAVRVCDDCLFVRDKSGTLTSGSCRHSCRLIWDIKYSPPPDWCPLRDTRIVIELTEDEK